VGEGLREGNGRMEEWEGEEKGRGERGERVGERGKEKEEKGRKKAEKLCKRVTKYSFVCFIDRFREYS
jgi:hypothetical protein